MDELNENLCPNVSLSRKTTEAQKVSWWDKFQSLLFRLFASVIIRPQKVDCISLGLLKEYFLEPHRRQLLKDNKEILAVAIKRLSIGGKIVVTAALFDSQKEEILNQENPVTYMASKMDAELETALGSKDMIVLT
ncbi:MAG: hypothetical protein IKK79_02990 [Spirochaetaceae bacterium]|nr:hypothetical protein [Spirochaetaceae bacterium]